MKPTSRVTLRPFQPEDFAALVPFWNEAFANRPNFQALTESHFRRRVLECPAFDPHGLILAWHQGNGAVPQLAGLVHAFRPAPSAGVYAAWEARHAIALIYVQPQFRAQGIGSRLLQAAENWLYYCPVFVGHFSQPCYGSVEGPRPPLFGSSQHMAISARETALIHFLARRGYRAVEAGDVTLAAELPVQPRPPAACDLEAAGLRVVTVSDQEPFTGREPAGREAYTLWRGGDPYAGLVLVDADGLLQAHVYWYPLPGAGRAAIGGFWVASARRRQGLGRYLLDRALAELAQAAPPRGGYGTVEVLTHLAAHPAAVAMYQRRGFEVVDAWVNLVKT